MRRNCRSLSTRLGPTESHWPWNGVAAAAFRKQRDKMLSFVQDDISQCAAVLRSMIPRPIHYLRHRKIAGYINCVSTCSGCLVRAAPHVLFRSAARSAARLFSCRMRAGSLLAPSCRCVPQCFEAARRRSSKEQNRPWSDAKACTSRCVEPCAAPTDLQRRTSAHSVGCRIFMRSAVRIQHTRLRLAKNLWPPHPTAYH